MHASIVALRTGMPPQDVPRCYRHLREWRCRTVDHAVHLLQGVHACVCQRACVCSSLCRVAMCVCVRVRVCECTCVHVYASVYMVCVCGCMCVYMVCVCFCLCTVALTLCRRRKIPELIDTVFIVLRKKPLIFLHWYHHVTVVLYCWHSFAQRSSAGAASLVRVWHVAYNGRCIFWGRHLVHCNELHGSRCDVLLLFPRGPPHSRVLGQVRHADADQPGTRTCFAAGWGGGGGNGVRVWVTVGRRCLSAFLCA